MESKNILLGILGLVAVGVLAFSLSKPAVVVISPNGSAEVESSNGGLFGISQRASKFTDVEVTNELQTRLLTVLATSTFAGAVDVGSFVEGGSITSLSTTGTASTVTPANVCENTLLNITSASTTATYTLPSTTTLFAACLSSIGDVRDIAIYNTATSSIIAAGAGGTLHFSSSSTIQSADTATLRFIRNAATTYRVLLINQPS